MKITLKNITLKNDTLEDIKSGNIDLNKFIEYIRVNVEAANNIINTKLLSLDEDELYELLSPLFIIELDDDDLFRVLRNKYNKHYVNKLTISTNLVDKDLNKYTLVGATTRDVLPSNRGMLLSELRKIVNSYDLIVLGTKKYKIKEKPSNAERYEDFEYYTFSLESDPETFDYLKSLLKKDLKDKNTLKRIISLVEQYLKELIHQAKEIIRLDEEEESLKPICKEYKNAYESNFSKKTVFTNKEHKRRY